MTTDTEMRFSDLQLSEDIQQAIRKIGYESPSPIQAQAIPPLLAGKDILGVAQTGTGKTAAFALPLLSKLDIQQKQPQILCLAPTRELAIQVAEAFQTYAQCLKGFKVLPIYGGTEYRGQIRQLERGVHVVVGTPGRVMDHMRKGTLKLDQISALVLDEADEMLRMGFIDDVEWILEQMPAKHQSAFFSATMPAPIKKLTQKYLNKPEEITIKVQTTTAPGIRQRYIQLKNNEKLDILTRIMEFEEFDAAIVFVRTKNATLEVSERLQARGYAVSALNGDIAQNQREKIVSQLKSGKLDIIVATDVAARGLDVERISHVINYDVPYDTESYVHRIGRTGRAGRTGDAILFVNGRERRMLQAIEKATRKKIDTFEFPTADVLNERKLEQLFDKINTELQKDLREYQSVMEKYLAEHDIESTLLAAALASIEADSQPFYISQAQVQGSRGRFDKDNRRDNQQENRKAGRKDLNRDASLATFRIEVGHKHRVEKKDIVGAIANEAGIESRYMGKIHIHEEHSTIELPEGMPRDVFEDLKQTTVRGQRLSIKRLSSDSRPDKRERKPTRSSTKAHSGSTDKPPRKKDEARKKPRKTAAEKASRKKGLEKKARKQKTKTSDRKSA